MKKAKRIVVILEDGSWYTEEVGVSLAMQLNDIQCKHKNIQQINLIFE